jgi:chromosome partitioning protein
MHKIIAIINQKGGVGKTTTSINFSTGLAMAGYSVLLIDMDPQAHSTIGLGVEPGSFQNAIHDVLINKRDIRETILHTKTKNLEIVPASIRLDLAEQQLTPQYFKEERLNKAIRNLDYDFIIIDCRPTLGTLTVNALYASNFIIVPLEMSRYSLDGFADLIDTITTVKNSETFEHERSLRLLINKFDSRKKISIDWITNEVDPYKHLIFDTKIRQNEALNQAHMAQEPIFNFDPKSHGAEDYKSLTQEFLNLCHLTLEKN